MTCEQCSTLRLNAKASCGYHKVGTEEFDLSKLGPEGLSLEMYYALYPLSFAYIYAARMPRNPIVVRCPTNEFVSFLLVKRPPDPKLRLKNLIKTLISPVKLWSKEVCNIDYVANQVMSGYATRRSYRFNLNGLFNYICPAAFSSIYPHVFHELKHGSGCIANKAIACPDHAVDHHFEFLQSGDDESAEDCGCYDFSGVSLQVSGERGEPGEERGVPELLCESNVKCFTAYQTLTPYFLTLQGGGNLNFYTYNTYSAVVQCPSVRNKVEFVIYRDPFDGRVYHRVRHVKGRCPMGYEPGDTAEFKEPIGLTAYLMYVAYLYCVYALKAKPSEWIRFRDPLAPDGMEFTVARAATGPVYDRKDEKTISLCVADA